MGARVLYPNIYWELTSVIFDVTLCLFLFLQFADTTRQNRRYRWFMYVVTVATIIDVATVVLCRGDFGILLPKFVYLFANTVNHMMSGFVPFYFMLYVQGYVDQDTKENALYRVENILFHIYLIIWIGNLIYPYMMDYDPVQITFEFSPLFFIVGYGIPFFFIFATGYTLIRFYKHTLRRIRFTMYFLYVIMWVCAFLLAVNPTRSLYAYYLASLGLFIGFMSIENSSYKHLVEYKMKLEVAKKDAEEANRQKTEFLAAMSHEIRTPLTGVLGTNELILRSTKDENIREYAENIESAGETLLYLVNDILDMSRMDTEKFILDETSYELGQLLKEVEILIRNRAEDKGLELKLQVPENLPNYLIGDEARLRQILVNILSNAVKYTHKGSIILSIEMTELDGQNLFDFVVRDTGIGISEEDLPYLFSKYSRVDAERNQHIEGTGLGLSIVQGLTEAMGGTVHVDSVYGVGSVFQVQIPQKIEKEGTYGEYLRRQQTKQLMEKSTNRREEEKVPLSGKILVVDDNEMNRKMMQSILLRLGLTVETADSGFHALRLLKETTYDVVLMDIMMPEMDGVQTLHSLREYPNCDAMSLPVVALTANATVGAREEYLGSGFDEYLTKPVNIKELEETLRAMLMKGGRHE